MAKIKNRPSILSGRKYFEPISKNLGKVTSITLSVSYINEWNTQNYQYRKVKNIDVRKINRISIDA